MISVSVYKLLLILLIVIVGGYFYYNYTELKIGSYIIPIKSDSINQDELKTYVINLDRTPERYKKVKKQLDDFGLKHERFSAVDGYLLELHDTSKSATFTGYDIKDGKYELQPNSRYLIRCPNMELEYLSNFDDIIKRTLTAGEFGCYCSHMEMWHNMASQNIKYALVLEDDITLEDEFSKNFAELITNLPKDWDIIYLYLGYSPGKQFNKIVFNDKLLKIMPDNLFIYATAGYLISKKGAEKLMKYSSSFSYPIDNRMSQALNERIINAYKTKSLYINTPLSQDPRDSTIHEMGRNIF
ncbi:MAG: glycosyltransferase family 25 protein [Rickettsiaceae bacterium]|nr:glycosyltransferase family 25 protein [Rickettsiaceae bacterium]